MRTLAPNPTLANMVFRVLLCNWLIAAVAVGSALHSQLRRSASSCSATAWSPAFSSRPPTPFPHSSSARLKAKGHAVEVINAGVSGDTTANGLERIRWAVPERTDAVILELGANDALRGLDPARAKANLEKIITTLKADGAEVLLAGMLAPRNLGEDYARAFDAMYPELAEKHGLILYPFFLDGIALNGGLNLGDGLHPNPKGVAEITKRILPAVEELIARVRARQPAGSKG